MTIKFFIDTTEIDRPMGLVILVEYQVCDFIEIELYRLLPSCPPRKGKILEHFSRRRGSMRFVREGQLPSRLRRLELTEDSPAILVSYCMGEGCHDQLMCLLDKTESAELKEEIERYAL